MNRLNEIESRFKKKKQKKKKNEQYCKLIMFTHYINARVSLVCIVFLFLQKIHFSIALDCHVKG